MEFIPTYCTLKIFLLTGSERFHKRENLLIGFKNNKIKFISKKIPYKNYMKFL